MDQKIQIELSSIQNENIAFWSAGNRPTQSLHGLSVSTVLLNLKSLYLLCERILASSSYYFESEVTREVTERLKQLFEQGKILYFVDSEIENFIEHGMQKIEKSPSNFAAYQDRNIVLQRAGTLESYGHILRRPSQSISDRIADLWVNDISSSESGTLGEVLSRVIIDESKRIKLIQDLILIANVRQTDFVWEYIAPKLQVLEVPKTFAKLSRRRLAHMYSVATSELLGAELDQPIHGSLSSVMSNDSKFDTGLFINCMDILGVAECLRQLDPTQLIILKNSDEFIYFREFYFKLIEITVYSHKDIDLWLRTYRKSALAFAQSGQTHNEFLEAFKYFCYARGRPPAKFKQPLDLLLSAYSVINELPIELFVEKMGIISGIIPVGRIVYREQSHLIESQIQSQEGSTFVSHLWNNTIINSTVVIAKNVFFYSKGSQEMAYQPKNWEKFVVYATGIISLGVVLFLLIRNEPFADPNFVVIIRMILSVFLAAFGGTIPGMLRVDFSGKGLVIRSMGALALFVLTWLLTPKVLPSE